VIPRIELKKERFLKKPKRVCQTTHVVTMPPNFAWAVPALTWLYILSFIEIHLGVSEPWGIENLPSALVWLVAFTTAKTTV